MQKIMAGEFFVDLIRMGMVEGVIRAAKATGADAIVRGSGELGGLVAGAILDLPVASAAPAAAKFYEPMIRPGVARAAAEHGLDGERVTAVDFEMLRIDRTPPSLETPGYVPPPNAINVRPEPFDDGGELPAWFDDLGGRPLVYVTLGTVMNGNIPLFRLIADALAGPAVRRRHRARGMGSRARPSARSPATSGSAAICLRPGSSSAPARS